MLATSADVVGDDLDVEDYSPRRGDWPELVQTWGEWLEGFTWDGFWTLTVERPYSSHALSKAAQLWAKRHCQVFQERPSWVFFFDVGRLGRLHLHGLTGHELSMRTAMHRDWLQHHGRNRGLMYERGKGATYYMAKYLLKAQGEPIVDTLDVGYQPYVSRTEARPYL